MCLLARVLPLASGLSGLSGLTAFGFGDLDSIAIGLERRLDSELTDCNGIYGCVKEKSDISKWDAKGFYENTSMVQGSLLTALCAKYRVLGDSAVLEKARKLCGGFFRIYDLSAPGGRGYYCKPWDWHYQTETSSDQYVYAFLGMDSYYPFADARDRKRIRTMIPEMARFWINRNYRYLYFGKTIDWQRCRFLSFATLGAKYSNDPAFSSEYNRLLSDPDVTNDIPFRASLALRRDVSKDGDVVYGGELESALSGVLSIYSCLSKETGHPYFSRVMDEIHDMVVNLLASDGTCYRYVVRVEDGSYLELARTRTKVSPPMPGSEWNAPNYRTFGPFRLGGRHSAAGLAALALLSPHHQRSSQWLATHGKNLLAKIAAGKLTDYEDPHHILPGDFMKIIDGRLRGEAIAYWLLAYWTMRASDIPNPQAKVLSPFEGENIS